MPSDPQLRIPLCVEERAGLQRNREPVRLGVPVVRGLLRDPADMEVVEESGGVLEHQARALALWPDRSIKWLLLDVLVSVGARERRALVIRPCDRLRQQGVPAASGLRITPNQVGVRIETGAAEFELNRSGPDLLHSARAAGANLLGAGGARVVLTDASGARHEAVAERIHVEESGSVRAAIVIEAGFPSAGRRLPLSLTCRLTFFAHSSAVHFECRVRNPRAARHPGGLWDLHDRGSARFEDLSLCLTPAAAVRELSWRAQSQDNPQSAAPSSWSLYQDSSGGESWDCDNHLDGSGSPSVTFRGYRVHAAQGGGQTLIQEGARATPSICAVTEDGSIAATALDFWQNFPKALRWDGTTLSVGLFPGECRVPFELQGGEQKRHVIVLELLPAGRQDAIAQSQQPLVAWVDPAWLEATQTLGSFVAASRDPNTEYLRYVDSIVAGPHSFESKREIIDEYGWRNYGDLYADHEAVRHTGPRPFISHYNNQYDFVYGALVHFLRTGDARWRRLGEDAARHTIDIDIYHTDADKAAFNHGLFWHTDHYRPAATCTHRTYSRHNGTGRAYGGGPSNEHNYTSGLLLYYYLSGDAEAAAAVRELADWVIAMDDGALNILGLIDPGPTGLASQTVDPTYHKPGRGAGNSINALLDGYQLSRERRYLDKAQELIVRCIHPEDDIEALRLTEPEHRWSYLVFLQVLGKYLDFKVEWGETDYFFHYARASLLHYARWMAAHEVPYKEVLHRVELPTETWPAHDVRKCHILHVAAKYGPAAERASLHQRAAFFFDRAVADVMSFPTAFLTRPLVILCVYGHVHAYFQAHQELGIEITCPDYSFGRPQQFVPQIGRVRAALGTRARILAAHLSRMSAAKLDSMRRLVLP